MSAPSLTKEEETSLILRWQEHQDEEARAILTNAHAGFVGKVAKEIVLDARHGGAIGPEDLLQAGFMGMLKALDRFDVARGFNFISYAVHYIRQEMRLTINAAHRIRIPEHQKIYIHRYAKTAEALSLRNGNHSASFNDILDEVDKTPYDKAPTREEFIELLRLNNATYIPGDENVSTTYHGRSTGTGHTNTVFFEIIPAPEPDQIGPDAPKALALLDKLGERRRTILCLRHGLEPPHVPHTLEEIGKVVGLTRERVRQIEAETMKMLRVMLKARGITAEDCLFS